MPKSLGPRPPNIDAIALAWRHLNLALTRIKAVVETFHMNRELNDPHGLAETGKILQSIGATIIEEASKLQTLEYIKDGTYMDPKKKS